MLAAATTLEAAHYSLVGALSGANQPFSEAFVSYSIEFASFPDFAGENILQGVWPLVLEDVYSTADRKQLEP